MQANFWRRTPIKALVHGWEQEIRFGKSSIECPVICYLLGKSPNSKSNLSAEKEGEVETGEGQGDCIYVHFTLMI